MTSVNDIKTHADRLREQGFVSHSHNCMLYQSEIADLRAYAERVRLVLGIQATLLEYFQASVAFNNSHGDGPDGETLEQAIERERKAEERFDAANQAAHAAIAAQTAANSNSPEFEGIAAPGVKPFAYFVQPSSFGPFIECGSEQAGAFPAYRAPAPDAPLDISGLTRYEPSAIWGTDNFCLVKHSEGSVYKVEEVEALLTSFAQKGN